MRYLVTILSLIGLCAAGCGSGAAMPGTPAGTTMGATMGRTPAAAAPTAAEVEPTEARSPYLLRYVALGDSYTIGTSVRTTRRWPDQLVRALRPEIELELIGNLAVEGATSRDVIEHQLPRMHGLDADVVSLLVGVNDVVRAIPPDSYRGNVATILDELLLTVPPERIFVLSTPDYTLTPKGGDYGDRTQKRALVARFNRIMEAEASERGVPFVDIGAVAERVAADGSLVAADGLHPSGKQYAGWVELVAPVVRESLTGG